MGIKHSRCSNRMAALLLSALASNSRAIVVMAHGHVPGGRRRPSSLRTWSFMAVGSPCAIQLTCAHVGARRPFAP